MEKVAAGKSAAIERIYQQWDSGEGRCDVLLGEIWEAGERAGLEEAARAADAEALEYISERKLIGEAQYTASLMEAKACALQGFAEHLRAIAQPEPPKFEHCELCLGPECVTSCIILGRCRLVAQPLAPGSAGQFVQTAQGREPSCQVCGKEMVRTVLDNNKAGWTCKSCGATTKPTEPGSAGQREPTIESVQAKARELIVKCQDRIRELDATGATGPTEEGK